MICIALHCDGHEFGSPRMTEDKTWILRKFCLLVLMIVVQPSKEAKWQCFVSCVGRLRWQ